MYFRFHYGCTSVNSFFITCVLIVFRVIALGLVVLGLTWTLLRLLYTRGPICVVVLCTYFVSSDFEVGVYSVAWLIALCGGCTYVLRYMNMHGHGHAQSMEKYRVARTRYTFFLHGVLGIHAHARSTKVRSYKVVLPVGTRVLQPRSICNRARARTGT
jgi:hypothetical protein